MTKITKLEDLELNQEIVDWAVSSRIHVSLEDELEAFVDFCEANGKTYKSYGAAFRGWCRRSEKWRQERGGKPVDPRPASFIPAQESEPDSKAGKPQERLKADIGLARYNAWVSNCEIRVESGGVVVNAARRSDCDYIRRELIPNIARAYGVEESAVIVGVKI